MNPEHRLTCAELIGHQYMDQNKDMMFEQPRKKERVIKQPRQSHNTWQVRISVFQHARCRHRGRAILVNRLAYFLWFCLAMD